MTDLNQIAISYSGGPTALLELDGVRLLTDPTFDEAGGEYKSGPITLRELAGPALTLNSVGGFDYVPLSHDHHVDNLDHAGRAALAQTKKYLRPTKVRSDWEATV
jgi:L-ascorbate metabolism protein UlaG (beta-lactamase superfamily)